MPQLQSEYKSQMLSQTVQHPTIYVSVHFYVDLIVFLFLILRLKVLCC
jgi:hypothetical protein